MSATTTDGRDKLRNSGKELLNDARTHATRGKAKAQGEMRDFVADVEDLVKKVAHVADAEVTSIRVKVQDALGNARQFAEQGAKSARDRTNAAASATNDYVRGRPWTAIGHCRCDRHSGRHYGVTAQEGQRCR